MENRESKIESVEQKAHQRPRELGDQQRFEEKARELIGARDQQETLNREAQSDTSSVLNKSDSTMNGIKTDALCENVAMTEKQIKENPTWTEKQKEEAGERIKPAHKNCEK